MSEEVFYELEMQPFRPYKVGFRITSDFRRRQLATFLACVLNSEDMTTASGLVTTNAVRSMLIGMLDKLKAAPGQPKSPVPETTSLTSKDS